MDITLKYRPDVIIALLFLVVLIENYRVTGHFNAAFVVVVIIVLIAFAPK